MRRIAVRLSLGLFGSLATAATAHAVISIAGTFSANTYAERSHGSAACVAIALASIAFVGWLALAARALGGHARVAFVLIRHVRACDVRASVALLSLGGMGALAAVEALEQSGSLGDLRPVADAFGGSMLLGAAATVAAAVALVAAGRTIATWLLAATVRTAVDVRSWVASLARDASSARTATWRSRAIGDRTARSGGLLVRALYGLRAPPARASRAIT